MMCDPLFLKNMNEFVTCVNWNMMENSELTKYKPPENYLSTTYLTNTKINLCEL